MIMIQHTTHIVYVDADALNRVTIYYPFTSTSTIIMLYVPPLWAHVQINDTL